MKKHNGELVKMFHLIDTIKMSSKTMCDQVLSFAGKHIFMVKRF